MVSSDRPVSTSHRGIRTCDEFSENKLAMATRAMAQEVMLCDMCETSPVQMHCNSCAVNLCNGCVIKHLTADTDKDHHDVVLYKKKNTKPTFPTCGTHKQEKCEMKCQQCDLPVCVQCIASGSHTKHNILVLLELLHYKKDDIKKKTTELETVTYPKYEKAVSELEIQLQNLPQTYEKLMSEMSNQGKEWHREVDVIINQRKQQAEKMKSDDLATLKKLLEQMKNLLSALHKAIVDNNELLKSNNVTEVLDSASTSPGTWDPPPSIDVTPPKFTPLPIKRERLNQMFGTLTAASIQQPSSSIKLVEYKLTQAVKQLQLLDSPESCSSVDTGNRNNYNIICVGPNEVWVSGNNNKIKLFTIPGSLQQTITTKTGNMPLGITVNRQGDLIYTDRSDTSINRVRNGKTEKITSLQDWWYPQQICCTISDDLLATMDKSSTPNRVVRYSGSTEKQVIQFDDEGRSIFSTGYLNGLFLAENSDKDMICVSDWGANAVVVINQAGKLRFRYTGNLSSQKYKSFIPYGIVIDSMGHILVADCDNHSIHIIDHEGHFLRYIDNCQLKKPDDLTLDKNNTLYVAEFDTGKVKVIKYLT